MTQPVTRNGRTFDVDGPPPPPPSPADSSTGRIEGLPDPASGPPVRLVPLPSSDPASSPDPAVVGERLDAFLERATPTFRTAEGEVAVPIGFYMNTRAPPARRTELEQLLERAGFPRTDINDVVIGRGSPLRIAQVTQALIDAGKLPPPRPDGKPSLADRIRQMNFEWSVGIDCAGYVALASLGARGISRESAGFAAPTDESLSNLRARGFTVVLAKDLRAGDIISLHGNGEPEQEHRAIVREATPATDEEIQTIRRDWRVRVRDRDRALSSLKWDKVVVDSSWGGGDDRQQGGVARHTWWYEQTTGLWASRVGATALPLSGTPYAHASHEMFRPAVRR